MSEKALIQVEGLDAGYPGRSVMRGVDLSIERGQFVGLIGPNGAGKTTLLRAILGLIPGARGTVSVAGAQGRQVRKRVGYVPQRHDVAWDFPIDVASAVENATLDLRPWYKRAGADTRAAVAEALESVNLADLARRPARAHRTRGVDGHFWCGAGFAVARRTTDARTGGRQCLRSVFCNSWPM